MADALMPALVLSRVEVAGRIVDVVVAGDEVSAVDPASRATVPAGRRDGVEPRDGDVVEIDGRGGALLPGLWDHHLHLLALAAARQSVDLGGTRGATDLSRLRQAATAASPGQWIRAIGYYPDDERVVDRYGLDAIATDHPVRVQHSSGAMWILNSAALAGLDLTTAPDGLEIDEDGEPTGRLYGADAWLGRQLDEGDQPGLADIGSELAGYGIVGVTDATPYASPSEVARLARAARAMPQRVMVTGGPRLVGHDFPPGVEVGPVKLLLADHALPPLDDIAEWMHAAHDARRPVMVHCVTRASLVLAVAAWDAAGARPGDRIEHGSVVPPELEPSIRRHGLAVVTQPNFIAERGDRYLSDVDPDDVPHLYPCRRLIDGGIGVGGSTDAPFGHPDPWAAVGAAASRTSRRGARVGDDQPLTAARALDLFLTDPDDPGGPPRRVAPGRRADLCLLDRPLADALAGARRGEPVVAATIVGGTPVWSRPGADRIRHL